MRPLYRTFSIFCVGCFIVLLYNGCAAGLLAEEAAALSAETAVLETSAALAISTEGVLIADESILAETLDRVFIEGDELYIKLRDGTPRVFGNVTGKTTATIEKYGSIELPGEIYKVKGSRVNIRSSPFKENEYNIFQHRTSGQIVLVIEERGGWAYVQIGNHEFGWMSMAALALVSNKNGASHPVFQKCAVCKGSGHSIQKVTCSVCTGKRFLQCPSCQGKRTTQCYVCRGSGKLDCGHCLGKGKITCERCFGNGYTLDEWRNKIKCDFCSGSGSKNCIDCNGSGKIICFDCRGSGNRICVLCTGAGKIACYNCNQDGQFREDIFCQKCLGTGWIRLK
jgi:hypothetical protein